MMEPKKSAVIPARKATVFLASTFWAVSDTYSGGKTYIIGQTSYATIVPNLLRQWDIF